MIFFLGILKNLQSRDVSLITKNSGRNFLSGVLHERIMIFLKQAEHFTYIRDARDADLRLL
jgi:hypothetical protein